MPIRHVTNAFARLQKRIRDLQSRVRENEEVLTEQNVQMPDNENGKRITVELSIWSAFKVLLLISAFFLAYQFLGRITSILILLFVSVFFATALNPGVDRLEKWKIHRGVGTIILMVLVVSIFIGILAGLIPLIANEAAKIWGSLSDFANNLSQEDFSNLPVWLREMVEQVLPPIRDYLGQVNPEDLRNTITSFTRDNIGNYLGQAGELAGRGLGLVVTIFGGIFQTLLVFILTFFLIVERGNISSFFIRLFPRRYEEYLSQKAHAVQKKVKDWVHGQVILFFLVGLIAYIGLSIIGVEYALTLALIAGLAEFIPYVGPFIAFASAAPVAFNTSLSIGVATMALYVGIQMIEGNVLVPLVMKKTVGVSPVVTIIAMLIGWEFLGILGMIVAVPVVSIIGLFIEDYAPRDRKHEHLEKKRADTRRRVRRE